MVCVNRPQAKNLVLLQENVKKTLLLGGVGGGGGGVGGGGEGVDC